MRRLRYLVRINKDPDSDWGASVPDLPGCVATGKTIDAALRRIQLAMELHIQGLRADGIRIPRPRRRAIVPRGTAHQVDFYATVEIAA
jgi:predicted RNase H-like HicB family nuclease